MYAGQMMMLSIGIGAVISLGLSLRIIFKTRAEGGGWAEMKNPLYMAQSYLAFGLVGAGIAKAILPPQTLSIKGALNPAYLSAEARDRGHHCLFEIDGQLRHPGIQEKIEKFKQRFTSRERLSIEGYAMGLHATSGITKGFHLYEVRYDHWHYKSGEKIPTPRQSNRTYWVDHDTCDAALRGDSNYGVFDPLSFINLNDWFDN